MPQFTYSGNLLNSEYPFLSRDAARTVIVPQQDQTYVPGASGQRDNKNKSVPEAWYLENFIATDYGYSAAQFVDRVDLSTVPLNGTTDYIANCFQIDTGNYSDVLVLIVNNTSGSLSKWYYSKKLNSVYTAAQIQWTLFATIGTYLTPYFYSINGINYVGSYGTGLYKINLTSGLPNSISVVALSGIVSSGIVAATSAYGYAIVSDGSNIYWSSTLDPTDFVPSLVTGAGGGAIQGLVGVVQRLVPIYEGFIIYSTQCIISARYTGNSRYPFSFEVLPGSGGIPTGLGLSLAQTISSNVAVSNNATEHLALTSSGIQRVSLNACNVELPELSDYFKKDIIERFDLTSNTFYSPTNPNTATTTTIKPTTECIAVVQSRYVVFSHYYTDISIATINFSGTRVGANTSVILIYDLYLKRWSRLCLPSINIPIASTSCNSDNIEELLLLNLQNGQLRAVNFNYDTAMINAVSGINKIIVLGKYQFVRSNFLHLQKVEIENTLTPCTVTALSSLDGKNFSTSLSTLAQQTGYLNTNYFNAVGKNHSIVISTQDYVDMNSIILTFSPHGRY